MKTGLTKKQKTTNIYFNEKDSMIEVCTYNTNLKHRLTRFAEQYPTECRLLKMQTDPPERVCSLGKKI